MKKLVYIIAAAVLSFAILHWSCADINEGHGPEGAQTAMRAAAYLLSND